MKIEVIDKDGWRKTFSFEKTLFHIGSAAMNDLILDARRGGGVATRHAQLIAMPDGAGYRLVNLGDASIIVGDSEDKGASIPPHNVTTIGNNSVVKMGDFTLIFHGEAFISTAPPTSSRSPHIGLRLSLPHTTLAPHQTLIGMLNIGNYGDRAGAQFDLELDGIESDCYRIEPAPLLSSGAESEVTIRFYHRGSKPPAGEHAITIRAIAPQAYPGEEAAVTCSLQVQPFFKHTLRPTSPAVPVQTQPVTAQPVRTRETAIPQDLLPPPMPSQQATAQPQEVLREPATAQIQELAPSAAIASAPRAPTPPPEDWWSIPEKPTVAIAATLPAELAEQGTTKPDVAKGEAVALIEPVLESPIPDNKEEPIKAETPAGEARVFIDKATTSPYNEVDASGVEPEETPATPPVTEPDETPGTEATSPRIEPEPTGKIVAETPPATADDWWGGPETPSIEKPKPEILALKAATATLPDLPVEEEPTSGDARNTGTQSGSTDDDWWSET